MNGRTPSKSTNGGRNFDVVILGTGIAGTILGAILARNGVRTLLIEQALHPRFAIGESTVPETTFQFRLLAMRYGVPEIGNLSTFPRVRRNICTTSGVKRNFSFVFHRAGEPHRATECAQLPTLAPPMGPDVHLYRQDVDQYLLSVAVSYGATVRQKTEITGVEFRPHGVELRTAEGEVIETEYVVDAGGIKAPIAQSLGLRHAEPKQRTHSRSIYTHLHGVIPFDACMAPQSEHGLPSPLSQGTLHHLFDGGWMWVIPFNNHPSSTNRLCSVGLQLDPRKHPPTGLPPEEEFRRFIARFPALAKQFSRAVSLRGWVSTDRLQFSSSRVLGDRYFLMPHAYAFVDPLFSSGLGISMGAINGLAWRLIAAKQDGDYSEARFASLQDRVAHNFEYFDQLVSRSYVAFSDFNLWNAWYKVWLCAGLYGAAGMLDVIGAYYRENSVSAFDLCEKPPYNYIQAHQMDLYAPLFESTTREVDAFAAGQRTATQAADHIYEMVEKSNLWPAPWGHARRRHPGIFTIVSFVPLIRWIKNGAPDYLREHYFNRFQINDVLRMTAADWSLEFNYTSRLLANHSRDFFKGYNNDWRQFLGPDDM
jgi:FADH2 O2-dependent halogenase